MAASSSSSSSTPKWTYEVFLSFRGEDTRTNFVNHLYTALHDRGIYTFIDDQTLQRGKSVAPELLKAIEQSRFAIVVFSKNYADSSWCLDELVKIIDCKNSIGQTVLPVFYDVDPSEVRKQTGCFGKAFSKHEINGEKDEIQLQRWRNALSEAASISGWDLPNTANGHESHCIKQIVGNVLSNFSKITSSNLARNLIGMESRVENVKSLLLKGSDEVHMVGILGMGGAGKTTLARAVFDDISNRFEGRYFVENVREVSKSRGLQSLQRKILSQILLEKELEVPSVHEGITMMSRLCHKRVLLVLDDVDHVDQLEALAGERGWFGKGSRIIITTRNKRLLVVHGVNEIHEVDLLNDYEALLLFNKYAFISNNHLQDYADLSRVVVNKVGGLPLALKVLGSSLYGRTMAEWKGVVNKLMKHVPNAEILDVLKISFDGLERDEKEIFLDIACFFVGRKKDDVSEILDCFDFFPDIGLSVLVEKCLLNVSDGKLQMHDLIKELAWDIVYQMDPREPGRRSRLWLPDDVSAVWRNDTGTEALECIQMHNQTHKSMITFDFQPFRNLKKLRLLDVSFLFDLCWDDWYKNMKKRKINEACEHLPNELRWIRWQGYPLKSLPPTFRAEKLVSLHMQHSKIVQLWEGRKILGRLKSVDLSHSGSLTRTPDFSGAPNLEKLILVLCISLIEVHPSLGDLQRLTFLDLSGCWKLKRIPSGFNMTSLEILILTNCCKLKVFPQIVGDMKRLKEIYLGCTAIEEVHPSIEKLTGLVKLDLTHCKNLRCLPSTIGHLKCLKTLDLSYCPRLKELPKTLEEMECLAELYLSRTPIKQPPSSILLLKNLNTLSIEGYNNKPTSLLASIFSSRGKSPDYPMEFFVEQNLSGFLSLKNLTLVNCNSSEIPSNISQFTNLEVLNLGGSSFTCLPDSLCQLSRLKELDLRHCKKLKALPKLPSSIAMLVMDGCESLESLGDLLTTKHDSLHAVSFWNCFKLMENEQCSGNGVSGIADILLQTILQGRSIIKHHEFSIVVPGREIPNWISAKLEEDMTNPSLQLKLLPNWDKGIAGFAMSICERGHVGQSIPRDISISLGHMYNARLRNNAWNSNKKWFGPSFERDHVWVGYISLDFLGQLIFGDTYKKGDDWVGGTETSFLRIQFNIWNPNGKFGIHVVYKDDVKHVYNEEEDDHNISSLNYLQGKGFSLC